MQLKSLDVNICFAVVTPIVLNQLISTVKEVFTSTTASRLVIVMRMPPHVETITNAFFFAPAHLAPSQPWDVGDSDSSLADARIDTGDNVTDSESNISIPSFTEPSLTMQPL